MKNESILSQLIVAAIYITLGIPLIVTSMKSPAVLDPNNANTEVSFSISTKTDNLNELDEETLSVIGTVTSANVGAQDLIKTGTIIDIDPNPFVEVSNVKDIEGNSFVFTIRLLNANLEPMQNYLSIICHHYLYQLLQYNLHHVILL